MHTFFVLGGVVALNVVSELNLLFRGLFFEETLAGCCFFEGFVHDLARYVLGLLV